MRCLLALAALCAIHNSAFAQNNNIMQAPPFSVALGGYYNTVLYSVDAYVLSENRAVLYPADTLNIQQDAEVHVKGKTRFDNGLKLAFRIEFEASDNAVGNGTTDMRFLTLSRDEMGRVEIGATKGVARKLQVMMPSFLGWNTDYNRWDTWRAVSDYAMPLHLHLTRDAQKISYISPRRFGWQFGISITPSAQFVHGGGRQITTLADERYTNIVDLAARYARRSSYGVSKVSLTQVSGSTPIRDNSRFLYHRRTARAIGFTHAWSRFEIGGNFFNDETVMGDQEAPINKRNIMHLAAAFKPNDGIRVGVAFHDQSNSEVGADISTTQIVALGARLRMGGGLFASASYEYVDFTDLRVARISRSSRFSGIGLSFTF